MVPGLPGSYEESPPSVVDLAVRDRRWCQGNLQHLAVLPARGLHWISRLHMLTGVGSYVTAPLWLLFLLAGILIALQARFVPPDYFPQQGKSLFPLWPVVDPVRAMWMFVGTMGLLLVPKLLGFTAVLFHGAERRGCGGAVRLLCGLLLESVIAGLLAPVVMLTQTVDIVAIAIGRDSGWNPQRRDDGSVPLRETVRKYRRHTFMGLAMAVAAWLVSPSLAAWMSPVIVGLALAIPLVTMTSWRSGLLARLGILRIPEEVRSPAVLQRARTLAAEIALETATRRALPDRLLQDDALLAAHYAMLPPPRRRWIDPPDVPLLTGRTKLDEAPSLQAAWEAMTRAERAASLADRAALDVIATRSV
jgi:membrane glycosyltransferase